MPEICRFLGVVIWINFGDHPPPHFHAQYGGSEALVDIEAIAVSEGWLPPRIRRAVLEWARVRQPELRAAWRQAQRYEHPAKIPPLS